MFYNAFNRYSSFIRFPDQHTPGSISDVSPDSNGFLSFVRLIGVAYFTRHRTAFQVETPIGYFKSYFTPPEEHHKQWYDSIRMIIWERITFEDQLPPSLDALKLHWLRSIWVIHYWRQAHLIKLTL